MLLNADYEMLISNFKKCLVSYSFSTPIILDFLVLTIKKLFASYAIDCRLLNADFKLQKMFGFI